MTYLLRLVVPDRPGVLGAVATALGTAGVDIVSVDVLERGNGVAIDDVVVDLPPGRLADSLITAAQAVPGVVVESLRPYAGQLDTHRELELLDALARVDGRVSAATARLLADELPRVLHSAWSIVLRPCTCGAGADGSAAHGHGPTGGEARDGIGAVPDTAGGGGDGGGEPPGTAGGRDGCAVEVLATSGAAPSLEGVVLPWLPLTGPVLLPSEEDWLPERWQQLAIEMMAAPFDGTTAVLLGRSGGPAYRRAELLRLAHLTGIAATVAMLPPA